VLVIRVLFSTAVYLPRHRSRAARCGSSKPGPDHGHPAPSRRSREPAGPQPLPLLLRAVADARAPQPEVPGKEWLKVRTSDLGEWERVLRTIVPEHESIA